MKTNVRSYTNNELLDRVKELEGFTEIPKGFWLIFIRSNEDEFDAFDDKVYLFFGERFLFVTSCTTNKGAKGNAVIEADQWMYDGFIFGLHKGKMDCLRQNKPFYFYRDKDGDEHTEETGKRFYENIQTQFHGSTYHKGVDVKRTNIGAWSEGCIVCNDNLDYEYIIEAVKEQSIVTGCLLQEFGDCV